MMDHEKSQIKIKNLIEGKTLKELGEYFETKTKSELVQAYNNIRVLINVQYAKSVKVPSVVNMAKYHREIFDFEIICDCIIEAIGPIYQTENMKKWDPFPFNDEGTRYRLYRNYRFKNITGIAQKVTDDVIIELLKDDSEQKKIESTQEEIPSKLKQIDTIALLKRLEHIDYVLTPEDEEILNNPSFKKWRSVHIKKLVKDTFDSAFSELETKGELTNEVFFMITPPPSDWFKQYFINSFEFHCNHPKGKYYEKCNNKQFKKNVNKRLDGVLKKCFILI